MNRELRRLQATEEKRHQDKRARGHSRRALRSRIHIRQFLSEVRTELKRVAWPSRREVMVFTTVTLITATAVTLFVFGLDFGFKRGILSLLELR